MIKNINFNKNETESKMENSTHSFRETNLVLQPLYEAKIKSKNMMSWSSPKKKGNIFCTIYFVWRKFFNICLLSQCRAYWIHFQNIHFYISKSITSYTFLLVSKITEQNQTSSERRSSKTCCYRQIELSTYFCFTSCYIWSFKVLIKKPFHLYNENFSTALLVIKLKEFRSCHGKLVLHLPKNTQKHNQHF